MSPVQFWPGAPNLEGIAMNGVCRYCGKKVELKKKGRCAPHIVHKGKRCVGSAQLPKEEVNAAKA